MGINFPNAPTLNQLWPQPAQPGLPVYRWDGQKWVTGATDSSSGNVRYDIAQSLTQETPPSTALSQRTQARTNIAAAPLDALAYSGIQINGSMDVSQENGATGISIGTFKYVVDGCFCQSSGSQNINGGQANASPPPGYSHYVQMTLSVANASPGPTDLAVIALPTEGYRIARLGWGTNNAQPLTIAFWVRAARAGNYSGAVRNGATNNRSYAFPFTIIAASTWEYKTVTIPGDGPPGTWATDNTSAMTVSFAMMSGTTYQTAPNTWTAGMFLGVTGTMNGIAQASDVFQITGVVVLPGLEAPTAARAPLIMRPYDQELATCRRYFQWNPALVGMWVVNSQTALYLMAHFGEPMRTAQPNLTLVNGTNAAAIPGFAFKNVTAVAWDIGPQGTAGGTVNATTAAIGAQTYDRFGEMSSSVFTFDARL